MRRCASGTTARPLSAAHHGKAALRKIERLRARRAGTAAEPQHRPLGRAHEIGQLIEQRRIRRLRSNGSETDMPRARDFLPLHVNGHFQRDRTARRRERGARGRFDHRNGGAALPYAEIGFGDRPQHIGLTGHIVDGGAIAIHVGPIDLRGDVQDRRAGGERLDLRARGVPRRRPGAGDDHAKGARHPRIGIGHVHCARLAAGGHEANTIVPRDRVEDRHVVDGDHAEHGADADLGKRMRDGVAHGFGERNHFRRTHGSGQHFIHCRAL